VIQAAGDPTGQALVLDDEQAQEAFGARLADACDDADPLIFLVGDLGAGKTTLARGFLRRRGHRGAVKSPTYTLVEPYEIGGRRLFHLDLYRVAGAEELDYLGLREMLAGSATLLVEWPENAGEALPTPDLFLRIGHLANGRRIALAAGSALGREILARLQRDSA
jgi:tRNA threonylcarbamoyladenosine biosynthesis protein TsaE